MYLEDFKIRNFKSCLKTDLTLNKEITSLIGINGSGKTNVLKAIASLAAVVTWGRNNPEAGERNSIQTELQGCLRDKNKKIKFSLDCSWQATGRSEDIVVLKQTWDFSDYIPELGTVNFPLGWLYRFYANNEWDYLSYPNGLSKRQSLPAEVVEILGKEGKKLPFVKVINFLRDIKYYSASQFVDPGKCPASIELEDEKEVRRPLIGPSSHSSLIANMYRHFKDNTPAYEKFVFLIGPKTLNLIDEIDFKEFSIPSNKYEVISAGRYKLIEANRKIVIPELKIDGKLLSLGQLSEGTFKTISLLFYLLTDVSGMVLIEEPEVSIHRGLLASILEIIKTESKYKQIVISTHSEAVIDEMKPEWVRVVRRIPRKGTEVRTVDKMMSEKKYKILKEYLGDRGNLGEYFKEGDFENA